MKQSEKTAFAITLGLIAGVVLFLLVYTINKEVKEQHEVALQEAYEKGYIEGVEQGKQLAMDEIKKFNHKNGIK